MLVAGLAGLLAKRRIALAVGCALVAAVVLREIVAPDGAKGIETALRLPLIFLAGGLIYLWRESVPLSLSGLALALVALVPLSHTPALQGRALPGHGLGRHRAGARTRC